MTELERLAVALLAQWRADGGGDHDSIAVSALLDRVLPYRAARRILGIDASEDYEALLLRLLSEEEALVQVTPGDAAELARATANSRLPDLGVLHLLRPASFTFASRVLAQPVAVVPPVAAEPASTWQAAALEPEPIPVHREEPSSRETESPRDSEVEGCWSCGASLPARRNARFCPFCGADQRQPACSACGAVAERGWKHCADCGEKL